MDARLIVPLAEADDEWMFGGKAVSLGAALRAGLPVPPGVALAATLVDLMAAGDEAASRRVSESPHIPPTRLAVRSSGIGEDAVGASFAGQHATVLNPGRSGVSGAIRTVWASARSASALAYRARKGLSLEPRIGVVIQMLVEPVTAGVLFTRNPVTGADERLIEASWGIGEAVVNGAVIPDRYRLDPEGRLLEFVPGDKDVKVWCGDGDGTVDVEVAPELRAMPCLQDPHVRRLMDLADACRRVWGPHLDLEWALGHDETIYLLQCRPITTLGAAST